MDRKLHGFKIGRRVGVAWLAAVLLPALVLVGCKDKAPTSPRQTRRIQPVSAEEKTRTDFLRRYGLQGRVSLIEFGTVEGCRMSDEGLDRIIWLAGRKAIPALSYARVESSKNDQLVKEYYESKSPGFLVHRDSDGTLAKAFDATAFPTFVIVGKFGRVRYRGNLPEERLMQWVDSLVAEETDPGPDVALMGAVELDAVKLLAQTRLPVLGGGVKSLGEFMGKDGLVLMFVDTTCPFSADAMKEYPMIVRTLSPMGINAVIVNLDDAEQAVRKHFGRRDSGDVPVVYDVTTKTKDYWHVRSVPTIIFIGSDKKTGYNGKAVWRELAAAIEKGKGLSAGTINFSVKGTEYG